MPHRLGEAAARRLGLDHNPMRRRVDRVEAWSTVLLVLLLLVTAPIAGAHFAATRQADQQARHRASPAYRVSATVTGPVRPDSGSTQVAGPVADRAARWTAPDGSRHQGTITVPYDTRTGRTTPIWTDAHGRPQERPRTAAQMSADAMAFGGFVAGGIVIGGLAILWGTRGLLDRRRYAAWDAEWTRTAPHWTRQY